MCGCRHHVLLGLMPGGWGWRPQVSLVFILLPKQAWAYLHTPGRVNPALQHEGEGLVL